MKHPNNPCVLSHKISLQFTNSTEVKGVSPVNGTGLLNCVSDITHPLNSAYFLKKKPFPKTQANI